jgi:membrane associated rhomboid family serine protease
MRRMGILERLERKFGQFGIENLTSYLIVGQVVAYIASYLNSAVYPALVLQGTRVLAGEWWRLGTMVFIPIDMSPVLAVLTWYLYYLYGTVLEREWGAFRYTLYIAVGYLGAVATAFAFPGVTVGNGYIFASVFLAFAYLHPDFRLYLFFILPVKVKWLAILAWIGMAVALVTGSWSTRVLVGTAVGEFLLFFGRNISERLRTEAHGVRRGTVEALESRRTYMSCAVCHATEKDRKIFYWCHECVPDTCYCEDHITTHTHRIA